MLSKEWRVIAKKAYSFRLIILAAILSGAEIVMPLFQSAMPGKLFAVLSFAAVVSAAGARLLAQKEFGDD